MTPKLHMIVLLESMQPLV